jgi:hypothetical protein
MTATITCPDGDAFGGTTFGAYVLPVSSSAMSGTTAGPESFPGAETGSGHPYGAFYGSGNTVSFATQANDVAGAWGAAVVIIAIGSGTENILGTVGFNEINQGCPSSGYVLGPQTGGGQSTAAQTSFPQLMTTGWTSCSPGDAPTGVSYATLTPGVLPAGGLATGVFSGSTATTVSNFINFFNASVAQVSINPGDTTATAPPLVAGSGQGQWIAWAQSPDGQSIVSTMYTTPTSAIPSLNLTTDIQSPAPYTLTATSCVNGQEDCWAVGNAHPNQDPKIDEPVVLKSSDAGTTWTDFQVLPMPTGSFCWPGNLVQTVDCTGAAFDWQSGVQPAIPMTGISCPESNTCMAVGGLGSNNAEVWTTTDGNTWNLVGASASTGTTVSTTDPTAQGPPDLTQGFYSAGGQGVPNPDGNPDVSNNLTPGGTNSFSTLPAAPDAPSSDSTTAALIPSLTSVSCWQQAGNATPVCEVLGDNNQPNTNEVTGIDGTALYTSDFGQSWKLQYGGSLSQYYYSVPSGCHAGTGGTAYTCPTSGNSEQSTLPLERALEGGAGTGGIAAQWQDPNPYGSSGDGSCNTAPPGNATDCAGGTVSLSSTTANAAPGTSLTMTADMHVPSSGVTKQAEGNDVSVTWANPFSGLGQVNIGAASATFDTTNYGEFFIDANLGGTINNIEYNSSNSVTLYSQKGQAYATCYGDGTCQMTPLGNANGGYCGFDGFDAGGILIVCAQMPVPQPDGSFSRQAGANGQWYAQTNIPGGDSNGNTSFVSNSYNMSLFAYGSGSPLQDSAISSNYFISTGALESRCSAARSGWGCRCHSAAGERHSLRYGKHDSGAGQ